MTDQPLTDAQHRALGGIAYSTPHGTVPDTKDKLAWLGVTRATRRVLMRRHLLEPVPDTSHAQLRLTGAGRAALREADTAAAETARAEAEADPYAVNETERDQLLGVLAPAPHGTGQRPDRYWASAPHPVRVRLCAKAMLHPTGPHAWTTTATGREAADRAVRASMGLGPAPDDPDLTGAQQQLLRESIDLNCGHTIMGDDRDIIDQLRGRGCLRREAGRGPYAVVQHLVTAAGYTAAGHTGDLPHLVTVAAADYQALLAARGAVSVVLAAAQERLFFELACPGPVDREIFTDLVRTLVALLASHSEEHERHRRAVEAIELQQADVRYRATQLQQALIVDEAKA